MESGSVDQNLQIEGDTLIKYLGADAFVEVRMVSRSSQTVLLSIAWKCRKCICQIQWNELESMPFREWNQKDTFTGKHKNNRHLCFQRNTSGIYRITGEFAETWAQCIPLLQDVKKSEVSRTSGGDSA